MEVVFTILGIYAVGLLGAVAINKFRDKSFGQRLREDQTKAQWVRAAAELGLNFSLPSVSLIQECRISGRLRGFEVDISVGAKSVVWTLRVDGQGIDRSPDLRTKAFWTDERLIGEGEKNHHALLDATLNAIGNKSTSLVTMRSVGRQDILDFLRQTKGLVSEGTVKFEATRVTGEKIVKLVRATVHIAEQLAIPSEATLQALAENALTDPNPEVRLRDLECLSALLCSPTRRDRYAPLDGDCTLTKETARVAQAALSEQDPRLRLVGAMLVGKEEGFAVLKELAESNSTPADLRARAVATLSARFPWERVAPTIAIALASRSESVLEAAILAVGQARDAELVGRVCALATSAGKKLPLAIVKTLEALERPEAEPTLLKLLTHKSDEVGAGAAKALERVGTVRAVELLLLVEKSQVTLELKTAAREAVRAIQGRIGPAEAGRLSLGEQRDNQGALSIAAEGGGLSLVSQDKSVGVLARRALDREKK